MRARLLFVTGTDTGVGKTLLTALLTQHLRDRGVCAHAMKPFCSGGTEDVDLLLRVQENELSRTETNPFYFSDPLAPLVAARKHRRVIRMPEVLSAIKKCAARCDRLLIEGSGGLLVPLGENFSVLDLIKRLKCEVVVVARNQLGTLNHTLLTVRFLQEHVDQRITVVLMDATTEVHASGRSSHGALTDVSRQSNARLLREFLLSVRVEKVPNLGLKSMEIAAIKINAKKIKKTLARILR